jgi:hypothetical protein
MNPQTRRSQQQNSARNLQAHIEPAAEGLPWFQSGSTPKRPVRFCFLTEYGVRDSEVRFSTRGMNLGTYLNKIVTNYNNQIRSKQPRMKLVWEDPIISDDSDMWYLARICDEEDDEFNENLHPSKSSLFLQNFWSWLLMTQ